MASRHAGRVIFTTCLPSLIHCSAVPCLQALLRRGKSEAKCARMFGVSVRTIGRVVARMKADSRI